MGYILAALQFQHLSSALLTPRLVFAGSPKQAQVGKAKRYSMEGGSERIEEADCRELFGTTSSTISQKDGFLWVFFFQILLLKGEASQWCKILQKPVRPINLFGTDPCDPWSFYMWEM